MADTTPSLIEVPPAAQVGNWVRDSRKAYRMSQAQLAKLIGSEQPFVARIEKGDVNLTLNTIVALGDAFNLSVDIKFRRRL